MPRQEPTRRTAPAWRAAPRRCSSGPLGRLTAAGVVAAFGLDDDFIGQAIALVFIRPEDVTSPPSVGVFADAPFNTSIRINGAGEGEYKLFFDVRIT